MSKTKTTKVILEAEQHEILQNRRIKEGITIDFQIREAIEIYITKIKAKK